MSAYTAEDLYNDLNKLREYGVDLRTLDVVTRHLEYYQEVSYNAPVTVDWYPKTTNANRRQLIIQ
jgi:hypothetical protein